MDEIIAEMPSAALFIVVDHHDGQRQELHALGKVLDPLVTKSKDVVWDSDRSIPVENQHELEEREEADEEGAQDIHGAPRPPEHVGLVSRNAAKEHHVRRNQEGVDLEGREALCGLEELIPGGVGHLKEVVQIHEGHRLVHPPLGHGGEHHRELVPHGLHRGKENPERHERREELVQSNGDANRHHLPVEAARVAGRLQLAALGLRLQLGSLCHEGVPHDVCKPEAKAVEEVDEREEGGERSQQPPQQHVDFPSVSKDRQRVAEKPEDDLEASWQTAQRGDRELLRHGRAQLKRVEVHARAREALKDTDHAVAQRNRAVAQGPQLRLARCLWAVAHVGHPERPEEQESHQVCHLERLLGQVGANPLPLDAERHQNHQGIPSAEVPHELPSPPARHRGLRSVLVLQEQLLAHIVVSNVRFRHQFLVEPMQGAHHRQVCGHVVLGAIESLAAGCRLAISSEFRHVCDAVVTRAAPRLSSAAPQVADPGSTPTGRSSAHRRERGARKRCAAIRGEGSRLTRIDPARGTGPRNRKKLTSAGEKPAHFQYGATPSCHSRRARASSAQCLWLGAALRGQAKACEAGVMLGAVLGGFGTFTLPRAAGAARAFLPERPLRSALPR
eukprot:scaffold774_cov248-Pinguiococcus_pyrenoidosus.AAC.18